MGAEKKKYVPIFRCKNCGERFTDVTQGFAAEEPMDVRLVLNTKCKGNAPLHCCSPITYGMSELVAAREV